MSFNSKDFRTLLYFAFASSCHPRHHNLIANLGYSNVEITNLEGREDFALDKMQIASSQIVGRRVTSNGSLLVTYKVEIMNNDYEVLFSATRHFLEKKLVFDDTANEGKAPHVTTFCHQRWNQSEIRGFIESSDRVSSHIFKSPSLDVHKQYCQILDLDAPLHHKEKQPTVPSLLHFSCHDLSSAGEDIESFQDITYYLQMKPSTSYKRCLYSLGENSRLSVVEDVDGDIFSTAFYTVKNEFPNSDDGDATEDHKDSVDAV